MELYSRATGSIVSISDHNYRIIPELHDEMLGEKNICLFCIKYRKHIDVKNAKDIYANPCRDMHINAIRESHRFGGSYTYVCDLGFLFWTSPVYLNNRFIGALTGSGYLGTDISETCTQMYNICEGALDETELMKLTGDFPRGNPKKIKALGELMRICAQSVSVGSNGSHESMKRRAGQQMELSVKIEEFKNEYPPGSGKPQYPIDKENKLLEALSRGETRACRKILNEILAALFFTNSDQFSHIQYRAIELAVLLSRIDTGSVCSVKTNPEANYRNFKLLRKAVNQEELTEIMYRILDEQAGQVISFQGIQHGSALKKAEIFILKNYTRKLSLDEIARASGFSAPYFSTIFKEEMGENLSSYLNRLRVEKASQMLKGTNHSVSKIARATGFEDQSWFSKIFKSYAGISPGKYRSRNKNTLPEFPEIDFSDEYLKMTEGSTASEQ